MVFHMKATFCKFFKTEKGATEFMRTVNQARKLAGSFVREMLVVTDGPEGNFAVVDLGTAIELDKWEV